MSTSTDSTARTFAIELNGARVETGARTLADLVLERGLGEVKVATALNGSFVSAGTRTSVKLSPGDKVEIVSARQGG